MKTLNHADYQLTIIDQGLLAQRLATQIKRLILDLNLSWTTFKEDPRRESAKVFRAVLVEVGHLLQSPTRILSYVIACLAITVLVAVVSLFDRSRHIAHNLTREVLIDPQDIQLIKLADAEDTGIGKNGEGQVGFKSDKQQGSGIELKSGGGGSGGNHTPIETQVGELPQPSEIQAPIPMQPKLSPALPVAGIDLDPALWNDSTAPQYGDPNSTSEIPSHGPGDGGGIGTNQGLGVGSGKGPGYGLGQDGNTGDGPSQRGCCGEGGSRNNSNGPPNIFKSAEVEQRARLLAKPEPQYTEEARRNQVTGTVTLRCVFSSAGDVVQIHTIQTLPFGLTERAIAAARKIKFIPAMKGGHPVSVWMQLEYNFNLY